MIQVFEEKLKITRIQEICIFWRLFQRCIMYIFRSREKYDPLKSWTTRWTLFFTIFCTNCIHEKIIYSTLLFILFISSSFKLYLLISKYQYGTSFERINSRGEKKKKKKLIIWAQELTSFNTKIILLNYRELTKPLIYGWGTAKIEFEFSVFRLYFEMLPHLFNT